MRNVTYCFEIAECVICLEVVEDLLINEQFVPFMCSEKRENIITFISQDYLPEISGPDFVTEVDVTFSEYKIQGKFIRTFHGTGTTEAYATLVQESKKQWKCRYLKEFEYHFNSIGSCFRHIALERILMENYAMILHASLIRTDKGIVFTGISGIGKSTQAKLWEENENADILNGDRTILRKKCGIWYGYGSPYAGSSKIYKNEGAEIKAIVSLGQSDDEDICERLLPRVAFRHIFSGVTINTWNQQFMNEVTEMILDICMNVPVFYLRCRAQRTAVICLKKMLDEL